MNPYFTKESLPVLFARVADAMQSADQTLSPNRAKEFAAARIRHAINDQFSRISAKGRNMEPMSDEEANWYDLIATRQWDFYQQLVNFSGSRTMLEDQDDPMTKINI